MADVHYKIDVDDPRLNGAPFFGVTECPGSETTSGPPQKFVKLRLWFMNILDERSVSKISAYLVCGGRGFFLMFPTLPDFFLFTKDIEMLHETQNTAGAVPMSNKETKDGHKVAAGHIRGTELAMMGIFFEFPDGWICTGELNSDARPVQDQKIKHRILDPVQIETMCGPKKNIEIEQTFEPGYFDFRKLNVDGRVDKLDDDGDEEEDAELIARLKGKKKPGTMQTDEED